MDFADVTLVCEEDTHIEAHKILLSACSPFFRTVLKKNKHAHPMIYMRGVKTKDLSAIVDFIYLGEAISSRRIWMDSLPWLKIFS